MDQNRVLSIFMSVVRASSFTQAAHAAGITPPAASRAIAQLEAHLGVRLLNRTTRKISLTDEGARLFELADAGLRLLDEAMDQTRYRRDDAAGTIRVTASHSFGNRQLIPLIREFQADHAQIHFDLLFEDVFTDLITAKIDVGFRVGSEPAPNLIARPLGAIGLSICAAPSYLREHGAPKDLDDLIAHHRCTGFRHPNTARIMPWELRIDGELAYQDVPAVITVNDAEGEVQAVLAGIGIGQLPNYMIGGYLASGALVPILEDYATSRLALFMYYPHRRQIPARVRQFIDFVMTKAGEHWLV